MAKTGRNEPCPCGSGKKYKNCCLSKDEQAQQVMRQQEIRAVAAPAATTMPAERTIATTPVPMTEEERLQAQKKELAEKKRKAFWAKFHAADYAGKIAIFLKELDVTDRMRRGVAFDMLDNIHREAVRRQEWRKLGELVDTLRDKQPKLYKADRCYYRGWQIEDAICGQQWELLEPAMMELAKVAYKKTDQFYDAADWLAYYGQLAVLAKAMRRAWRRVDKSEYIVPWAINEFMNTALWYETLAYLESIPPGHDIDETKLLSRVRHYRKVKTEWLLSDVAYIVGRTKKAWTLDDFRLDSGKKKKWRKKGPGEGRPQDGVHNLYQLSVEFLGYLHREHHVSYSKATLASQNIRDYITDRAAGELEFRESMVEAMLRESQGRSKPKPPRRQIENVLCPDRETLDRYLASFFDILVLGSRPHTVAATFEAVPAWLQFLQSRQLITPELCQTTTDGLQLLKKEIIKVLKQEVDGELLVAEIERRWEK